MKAPPSKTQFEHTMRTISAMKFYPTGDAGVRTEVMDLLAKMVDTQESLEWFRCLLRDRVPDWPGLAELRAIYCTARRPKDGIEGAGYSRVAGFTPGDIEQKHLIAAVTQKALPAPAEWEQKLLGAGKVLEVPDDSEALERVEKHVAAAAQKRRALETNNAEFLEFQRRHEQKAGGV